MIIYLLVVAVVVIFVVVISHGMINTLMITRNYFIDYYSKYDQTIYQYPWIHVEVHYYASFFQSLLLSTWIILICDNQFEVLRWCQWKIAQGSHCIVGRNQLIFLICLLQWIRMLRLWNHTIDTINFLLIA